MSSLKINECSICENELNETDDLVTTNCNHKFHCRCAQDRLDKKNRTDCHFCHQDSALGNALALKNLAKKGECSICESEWNWKHDIVITNCNHTFHRRCAQDRFDRRGRTDCHFCHQDSDLKIILSQNTTTTINEPTEQNSNRINPDKNVLSTARTENTIEKKENNWQCDECSGTNEPSTKRCICCGTPRFVLPSIPAVLSQRQDDATTKEYNQVTSSNRRPKNDKNKPLDLRIQGKNPDKNMRFLANVFICLSIFIIFISFYCTFRKREAIVYISDLPADIDDELQLHHLIRNRLQKTFQITPTSIQCYSKLGFGFMHVRNNKIKDRLVNDIKRLVLDRSGNPSLISFNDTFEFTSYIVIDKTNENKDVDFPKSDEILKRWVKIYNEEKSCSCEQISIQFPNIYRIILTSFNNLLVAISNPDFLINNLFAHVYLGANCSYLEDLPKSTTKEQLKEAISDSIRIKNLSPLSLHIELNKQTNNACIIATDQARLLATKSFIYLGDKPISKKETLTCRLLLHPISEIFTNEEILQETIFDGKATIIERRGENLVLEISDKKIFDNCLTVGVLSIKHKPRLIMEIFLNFNHPEDREIDAETWYQSEMIRYKPDIMQFVANLDHPIFHYKWNSEIWLEQFQNTKPSNLMINTNLKNHSNISSDQIRHLLRMTVMLNTISIIRKKKYLLNNQEILLNLDSKLKTIVYNHESLLEYGRSIELIKIPYRETKVKVINEDCVIVYEECCKMYKKPLLLNMSSATSPGGGYRKGDGAQEENLFRRSDYFRSLDIDLDHIYEEIAERYYCSSDSEICLLPDSITMYPIEEFGAIYTSGLTFFRKSEDKGYSYMEKPLEGVYSLAMAAYRNPKLDGNILSPKYSVGMRKKIENLFSIAYNHKHDCLILSAFGCGAFKNPPDHIAKLFRSVIEQYAGFFQIIIFAIINDHNTGQQHNPQGNFKSFKDELDGFCFQPILPFNKPNTISGPYRISFDGLNINDISIYDLQPCPFAAKCNELYDLKHSQKYSHPTLCKKRYSSGNCTEINDFIHISSFIHRNPCKYGVQCKDIDNDKHFQEYEHPSYCPNGSYCQDTTDNHEKAYRHLPLCPFFQKCLEYQKHIRTHCEKFRHCHPSCGFGNRCINFHDRQHMEMYKHPFPTACLLTPYHCLLYEQFTMTNNIENISDEVDQHCLNFAHVCQFGQYCNDTDTLHLEKSIHVPRPLCPFANRCKKLVQEDHLNSFTHPNIRDIRFLCKYADKCYDRRNPKHLTKFRHTITFEDSGVVRYYNLNKNIDFVQNQKDNIERVMRYIKKEKWETLKNGSIPQNIINWIRTVQPVHRCKPEIFESILLHGHVMSRDHMEQLKDPRFVAHSVLHHSHLQRIKYLRQKKCAQDVKEYIYELVKEEFEKQASDNKSSNETTTMTTSSSYIDNQQYRKELITNKEVILSYILSKEEITTIKQTAIEITQASMKLLSYPTGYGYGPDKDLGTNKNVFSILGPNSGHYYGDIFIVFKREILHHPDANFSIQAATSYASGNAFKWRPWLGIDPDSKDDRIKLFHKTKLHASVTGYEYATALELIATTSYYLQKKSMNIDLETILNRWINSDSHANIEGHLPQLIPLDYIDHIYMPQNIFDSFDDKTRQTIKSIFENRITKTSHEIEMNQFGPKFGPRPDSKIRAEYQDFVIKDLIEKFGQRDIHSISRPIQGIVITIPSTEFTDNFLLPLTISQAYKQYKMSHIKVSTNVIVYIYWQVMNGDMMLTLSNEQIDTGKSQGNLRCLISYIAEKPSTKDCHYYENVSYLHSGRPFEHEIVVSERKYSARSRSFFIGCNTDDFMTFCLEIEYSTGKVILSHSGSNSIYNHEKISSTFSKSTLDLTELNFIYISAGARTVPIRNLFITFEKQKDLHPTFDRNFAKSSSLLPRRMSSITQDKIDNNKSSLQTSDGKDKKSVGFVSSVIDKAIQVKDKVKDFFDDGNDSSLKPCSDGIYCLIQYSDEGPTHNSKFSHPCRFSELCRDPEPHLTHIPHQVPRCNSDRICKDLCNPIHRAEYRHTGWPDFLIPCRDQEKCRNRSDQHRIKYSHGERVIETISTIELQASSDSEQSLQRQDHNLNERKPCKWGLKCRDILDSQHCNQYSHSDIVPQQNDARIRCKWGVQCHDQTSTHRMKYAHP
ncbi:unnamed protein product [Rotaria sp. Silwood2]|nr:unnamed protein product [Rotaria sp. Silwood2]